MKFLISFLALALFCSQVSAKRLNKERWYQDRWCKGITEYTLPNRKRVDCLTKTHAIEADFGDKHYQAVGQALYYSMMTGLAPGLLIIIEDKDDLRGYYDLMKSLAYQESMYGLHIEVWVTGPMAAEIDRK
jgi:hypothetical protein